MPYVNGVRVYDLVRPFEESIGEGGPRASRAWLVPAWGDRFLVANGLLGLSTLIGGTGGRTTFSRPLAYPEGPGMMAREVTIRGVGVPTIGAHQIAWDSAIVSCNFALPQFNIERPVGTENEFSPADPLVYCSQSLSFGSQVVTVPKGVLRCNGKPLQQTYGRPVRTVTMNLVFHRLPFLIPQAVRDKVGSINTATFLGCAAGTLLFDGIETQREFLSDGNVTQETKMSLIYRPEAAWDKILDPDDASTWRAVTKAAGGSILPMMNMDVLIPDGYRA